jgi:predicted MPP superfamily phosphohydrolase
MNEGDEGRKVEKVLIEYYNLKAPPNTVVVGSNHERRVDTA